jgi:hypothetical protein
LAEELLVYLGGIMKILTDREILKKHDPSIRGRAYIELQIVNKLIEAAKDARYTLKVWDGYEEEGITNYDVRTAIFDLDLARIEVYDGDKYLGTIALVLGNDGHDIVSDYHTSLENFLVPVNALASWWGD